MKRLIMMFGVVLMMVSGSASANPQADLDQCESYCDSGYPNSSDGHTQCIADCYADFHEATGQGASVDHGWIEHDTQIADIRISDRQPICGTDPWACFNGTDESPDIRNVDVGIFGVFADSR